MRRAQAAMEFLVTYGWVMLIVLSVIGGIVYFGGFTPSRMIPEKCFIPGGLNCNQYQITPDGAKFMLDNWMGDEVTVDSFKVYSRDGVLLFQSASPTVISDGGTEVVYLGKVSDVGDVDGRVDFSIKVDFHKGGATDMPHNVEGTLYSEVAEVVFEGPQCYHDADSDTFGDALDSAAGPVCPSGYVLDNTDCNDGDFNIKPGVAEDCCDGDDNDCDGDTDILDSECASPVCDCGWTYVSGTDSCWKSFWAYQNYAGAVSNCASLGGRLPTLTEGADACDEYDMRGDPWASGWTSDLGPVGTHLIWIDRDCVPCGAFLDCSEQDVVRPCGIAAPDFYTKPYSCTKPKN